MEYLQNWKRNVDIENESMFDPGHHAVKFRSMSSIVLEPPRLQTDSSREYLEIERSDLKFGEPVEKGGRMLTALWISQNKKAAVKMLSNLNDREAKVLNSIRHKNIVQFYGALNERPSFGIVMELCEGGCLYDYLRNHTLEFQQAQTWARQIAQGMHYLHYDAPEGTITHKNLTSVNVVLSKERKTESLIAKLCGFGYSRVYRSTQSTKSHGRMQVHAWMAPERITGQRATLASDVYSFGIILWELVSQKIPFEGLVIFQVMTKVVNGERLDVPTTCPSEWEDLMKKCWSGEPKSRPSFKEIVFKLEGSTQGTSTEGKEEVDTQASQTSWLVTESDIELTKESEVLGEGRFGVVRKAKYQGKEVAAKCLHRRIVTSESFQNYVNMVYEIEHSNIVKMLGACYQPGFVILMEWVPTSLRQQLQNGPICNKTRLQAISTDVAQGLLHLHSQFPNPYVHGGLSSSNVFLDPDNDWKAKISDFECIALDRDVGCVSQFKAYVAPEGFDIQQRSPQMDVYSFGILLVEMYTCELPVGEEKCRVMNSVAKRWSKLYRLVEICTSAARLYRPSMSKVIFELDNLQKS